MKERAMKESVMWRMFLDEYMPYVIAVVLGVPVFLVSVFSFLYQWDNRRQQIADDHWCAQACLQYRVLVCQQVSDPGWSAPRRAAACVLDAEGSEIRFVIDRDGGK